MDEVVNYVNLAKNGNESAFEALLRKYQGLLLSMSRKYSDMCPETLRDSDDFLQEAEIAFYKAIDTYNVDQKITFGAYAKVCIRNRLISCVRALNSQKRNNTKQSRVSRLESTVQDVIITTEKTKAIYKVASEHLSQYERKIFEMYFSGMKAKEIAVKINKSEKSINNAIYRMKSKLSKLLKNNDT